MEQFIIIKSFTFDAAHRIWMQDICKNAEMMGFLVDNSNSCENKCTNPHGHTFYVDINFKSENLDEQGMVVDTDLLKLILKDLINTLDHSFIIHKDDPLREKIENVFNGYKITIIDIMPTCEGIAKYIYQEIKHKLPNNFQKKAQIESVEVRIATSIKARYREDSNENL